MKEDADRLGSFESDDESGFIWNQIKSILDDLKNEYNIDAENEEREVKDILLKSQRLL